MPLDLVSLGIGFTSGVVASAAVWNLTQQRRVSNPETTKLTATWALTEVSRTGPPAVMAERIEGLDLPLNSKVLVKDASGIPPQVLRSCDVRVNASVHANYVLGRAQALVFSSHMHPRANVVFTRDDAAVKKLQNEFTGLWMQAEPHVQRASVEGLGAWNGRHVEVVGTAAELMEYRGRRMLRLSENGHAVGVVTDDGGAAEFMGKFVRVVGKVVSEGQHVFLEARRIERVSPRQAAPVAV